MSPSRGLNIFLRARISIPRQYGRSISTGVLNSMFVQKATAPTTRTHSQIYISSSDNPYFNLSVEHFLLQNTHADSTILFLYINRPSVIIGRNQNPWVEVNQAELKANYRKVDLVRRRSGGGTVFHDEGNVNYSVICPPAQFDRDKHAQMVVRALRKLGSDRARVNERHDIVMDPKPGKDGPAKKISGSAYKLTRLRSLHHGTCLIRSPILELIGNYLSSSAKPYINARGVDSVPSPIQNFGLVGTDDFIKGVVEEFQEMYDVTKPWYVDEKEKDVPEIKEGIRELKSKAWIYGQTPQFTFDLTRTNTDSNPVHNFSVNFTARNMKFTDFNLTLSGLNIPPTLSTEITNSILTSPQRFYTIDWATNLLAHAPETSPEDLTSTSPTAKANADIRAALKYTGDMLNSYLGTKGGLFRINGRVNDNEFQKSEMATISKVQEIERIIEEERLRVEAEDNVEADRLEREKEEEKERGAKEWREKLIAMRDLKYIMKKRNQRRRMLGWSAEQRLAAGRRMCGLAKLIEPESKPGERESTSDAWQDRMKEIWEKMRSDMLKRFNAGAEQRTKGLRGLKALGMPTPRRKKTPSANPEGKVRLVLRGRKTTMGLENLKALKERAIKELSAEHREPDDSSGREKSKLQTTSGPTLVSGPGLYPSEPVLGPDLDEWGPETSQEVKIVRTIRRKGERGQVSLIRRKALKASGLASSGRTAWQEMQFKMKQVKEKSESESKRQNIEPEPEQKELKFIRRVKGAVAEKSDGRIRRVDNKVGRDGLQPFTSPGSEHGGEKPKEKSESQIPDSKHKFSEVIQGQGNTRTEGDRSEDLKITRRSKKGGEGREGLKIMRESRSESEAPRAGRANRWTGRGNRKAREKREEGSRSESQVTEPTRGDAKTKGEKSQGLNIIRPTPFESEAPWTKSGRRRGGQKSEGLKITGTKR